MTDISLEEKYEDSSSADIMTAISECEDKKDKVKLITLLRIAVRREEAELKEEIKQDAEDSKEEKRLLKETQVALFEARSVYLSAYRAMNAIMTGKSMLKNYDDFVKTAEVFKNESHNFFDAIQLHIKNLHNIKNG